MNQVDKSMKITLILTTIICLLPILMGVFYYKELPNQLAIHFNDAGKADNYMNKPLVIFGLPIFLAVLNLFTQFRLVTDPQKANYPKVLLNLFRWLVPVISVGCMTYIIFFALGKDFHIGNIGSIVLGILLIFIGNYLPKCHFNYTMGIKLPWTLNNEDNWNKTHRLAGFIYVVGGVIILLSVFWPTVYITLGVIATIVFIPMMYSFVLYRRGI
ncbi:SdpI family protein [Anaerosporobacter sp.]